MKEEQALLELKAKQLGIEVHQLASQQITDSYYGEVGQLEDDVDMHNPINIHEQFAKNQDKFNRVLNLEGLRSGTSEEHASSAEDKRKAVH